MVKVLLEKKFGSLSPASEDAYSTLSKIAEGTSVVADIKSHARRSVRQHAFIFVLLTELHEAQEHIKDFDRFRQYLMIRLGFCDIYKPADGEPVAIAWSLKISRDGGIPQEDANRLVDALLDFAEQQGFDRAALLAKTIERAGPMPDYQS